MAECSSLICSYFSQCQNDFRKPAFFGQIEANSNTARDGGLLTKRIQQLVHIKDFGRFLEAGGIHHSLDSGLFVELHFVIFVESEKNRFEDDDLYS